MDFLKVITEYFSNEKPQILTLMNVCVLIFALKKDKIDIANIIVNY